MHRGCRRVGRVRRRFEVQTRAVSATHPHDSHDARASGGPREQTWSLMTLRQKLWYVPGIALLLCGVTYIVLALIGPATEKARGFLLAVSPLVLLLPAIPMLAMGGSLRATVRGGQLVVVRRRAFVDGTPIVVPIGSGITLDLREYRSRNMQGIAHLVATGAHGETVLVGQAPTVALQRVVADLRPLLDAARR